MLSRYYNGMVLSRICKSLIIQRKWTTFAGQHKFVYGFTPYSRHFLSTSSQYESDSKSESSSNLKVDTAKVSKIVDQLFCLNLIEVNQLMNRLQSNVGMSDEELEKRMYPSGGGAGGASPAGGAVEAEVKKEKDVFTIKLEAVDAKAKIKIIKEVRTITGLGLKEAKDLVEKAPTVLKEGLKKEEAEVMKKVLEEAGAKVELE